MTAGVIFGGVVLALTIGWVRTINLRVQWLEEELDRRDEDVDD